MVGEKKNSEKVAVVMGCADDWAVMKHAVATLHAVGVGTEVRVISAHQTPDEASSFAASAAARGCRIIIAAAGMAAHLGGALAAHSALPVIGVPLRDGALDGLDALLSTVQMPAGVPVAAMAIGQAGAINAALFAVQILALNDRSLRTKFQRHRQALKKKVFEADAALQRELFAT
jgi:phosphoribosylaminoimidazole carboxylase PurE protein